jgi:hypothetical protein
MSPCRERRGPSIAVDLITAAVADDAVAAPELAVGEMDDAGGVLNNAAYVPSLSMA